MNFKLLLTSIVIFLGSLTVATATTTATMSFPVHSASNQASSSEEVKADITPATPAVSGKSQLVALLLAFFIGGLGIHRFYLGYTWQGVVQLLTFGGCGIWSLIDFIRIITGDLGPKSGDYTETL